MSLPDSIPAISVLLPVHNASRYVGDSVQSILAQTCQDFEFHIVDDGSTDDTADQIRCMVQNDPRVHFVQQSNAGFAVTLNRMLAVSRGRYIARMDADDISEPERFATQLEFLESHPGIVVVGSAVTNIDEDGDPYGVSLFPTDHDAIETSILSGTGGIIHPSVMMRRQAINSLGGYALDVPIVEDQDLWLRMASTGRLANLSDVLLRYRVHPTNMSFAGMSDAAQALATVLSRERARRGLPPRTEVETSIAVSDWERHRTWAWTAVESGHLATARKHSRRLIRQSPWRLTGWKVWLAATWPRFFEVIRRI